MTKRDFELLARAMHANQPGEDQPFARIAQWTEMVESVAQVCAESNPKFNRFRFVAMCEGEVKVPA